MSSDTKALRRYQAGVERALGLFDATNEWADYIAFLSRLIKSLQGAPAGADVPLKSTLAKYLAQCLRPSLPAGVHQKALEVYDVVFSLLGRDGLSKDLSLYLPGISHTLSFASLSTRPWFLSLYDEHLLKLPTTTLRPALKAIILSLLPGIEEESSEDFERTLNTLNRLRAAFARDQVEDVFWQSLFLASITSPNRRMGVLMYLIRYLPKLVDDRAYDQPAGKSLEKGLTNFVTVITPEPGLLIRCFATGLQDEQPLVQRGFLDLIVTHIPLSARTLQQKDTAKDLDILVSGAMSIVLKRDMSLNRRLWAWFLGQSEDRITDNVQQNGTQNDAEHGTELGTLNVHGSAYLSRYGLDSIIRTFQKGLETSPSLPTHRARPFRILISLMDRTSIGEPVVDAIFELLFRDLRLYQANAPSQSAFDEVFRSANVFFESIEPRVIAHNIIKLFQGGHLDLIEFIAINFSLDDDELVTHHTPLIAVTLSWNILQRAKKRADADTDGTLEQVTRLLSLILPVPSIPLSDGPASLSQIASPTSVPELNVQSVEKYYGEATLSPPRMKPPGLADVMFTLYENIFGALMEILQDFDQITALENLVSIVDRLLTSFPRPSLVQMTTLINSLSQEDHNEPRTSLVPFATTRSVSMLIASALAVFHDVPKVAFSVAKVIQRLINDFWNRLGPSTPQYHVECVEAIWALRSLSANLYLVDSKILSLLSRDGIEAGDSDQQRILKFNAIWTHTRLPGYLTPALDGDVTDPAANPIVLLKAAVLYILDSATDTVTDPYRQWVSNLSSLTLHFQAVMEGIVLEGADTQNSIVNLRRLLKLLRIAKSSLSLWKDVLSPQGPGLLVLEQSTSIILSESMKDEELHISLEILTLLHEGLDAPLSDSLVKILLGQLGALPIGNKLQDRMLESLQLLVSLGSNEPPPLDLLAMALEIISSPNADPTLEKWITLLCNAIPNYTDLIFFANLLKLTDCFCKRIQRSFTALQSLFELDITRAERKEITTLATTTNPERSITNLLSGLEFILARAHTKIIEATRPSSAARESSADISSNRARANNRLTAILCMQDAIRVCGQLWFWRPLRKQDNISSLSKSFAYISLRLRSRSRRMLEHLIQAETQECLETLMGLWVTAVKNGTNHGFVMNLLESLDGARPKFMMPAIFNAIYGRTNANALDADQRSSLSVDLSALQLVAFLTDYVEALEDDLLEEIWSDCTSFLRDILSNPMPHRQILLRLLGFLAVLCKKMENTNFGDQFRMRRELADSCTRLFTAIFTIKPGGFDESNESLQDTSKGSERIIDRFQSKHGIEIICQALPSMSSVIGEADRTATIYTGISTNITGPALRARSFPSNIGSDMLELLVIMSKAQTVSKVWKKDITDAFNDPRFFQFSPTLAEAGLVPVLSQLTALDKGLMGDVLSRLTAPATAGIMFGVGASSARAEADKQARGNLRRIALSLLANTSDHFMPILSQIITKSEELLGATPTSSPSSGTKGDLFLLLRAVICSFSQNNLASLWPIIDSELRGVFEDIAKKSEATLTQYTWMQAAKLLDLLLLLKPEEFQLHEWLYVTDTIDAIYPPASWDPVAMADSVVLSKAHMVDPPSSTYGGVRRPWLSTDDSRKPDKFLAALGSFFGHLSIRAFEDTYSLDPVDHQACRRDVLTDLFAPDDKIEVK
jgi:hypothetical protein